MSATVMSLPELTEILYQFYPRGISTLHPKEYEQSVEYNRRLKKCQDTAVLEDEKWQLFLKEVETKLGAIDGSLVYDNTLLIHIPSYYVSAGLMKEVDGSLVRTTMVFFVSIIAPFWAFKFYDHDLGKWRFHTVDTLEEKVVDHIETTVWKYFPDYTVLSEDIREVVITDIETINSKGRPVTVFNAIFVELYY